MARSWRTPPRQRCRPGPTAAMRACWRRRRAYGQRPGRRRRGAGCASSAAASSGRPRRELRMSDEPLVAITACLWPLAQREALTARVADAAALGPLAPEARFELSYADVAPTLGPRARAAAPAVLRMGAGAGSL